MAEEKNQMDFDEPTDGGMIPAEVEDDVDTTEDSGSDEVEEAAEVSEEENADEEVIASDEGRANLPLDVIEEAIGYGLTSREIESLGSDSVFGDDDDDPFAEPDENTGGSNSEVAELRKQVEQLRRSLEDRPSESNSDKLFGLLADDYDELFGGVGDDMTKTQKRNRSKVLQELDTLKAGYRARKRAIPSDRRLFKQAVRSVFGDHESKVVKKKFSESAKKRKSQFINRVNARDARRPKDGRTSAVDSVKKFLADRGYTDLESVETFE
jgi:hypothetical protein